MKKFYAIMAAAVAASGMASAQLPNMSTSIKDAVLIPFENFELTEAPAIQSLPQTITAGVKGQNVRRISSRAEEAATLNGEYIVTYVTPSLFDESATPFNTRGLTTKFATDDKGNVSISEFWFTDSEIMKGTFGSVEIPVSQTETETIDDVLTINGISSGSPEIFLKGISLGNSGEQDWYLAFADFSERKLYGDDLQWFFDVESGEGHFLWRDCGLAIVYQGANGWSGYFFAESPAFYKKNAEMTAMFYAGENGFAEGTCPVWTYAFEGRYVDQNNQPTGETFIGVFTAGWGGCGEPFRFILEEIEEGAYVAVAADQVGWTSEEGEEFVYCDAVLEDGEPTFKWFDNSGEGLNWMVANVGVDGDGNTVFTQDDMWILLGEQGILTYWQEGITVFDYYIGVGNGGGTEGVEAIESNDNAPVEYYNLQGVKVANPTPGQLYIVKQGSKVSKVIR